MKDVKVKPETVSKFERVKKLLADNPELPQKIACKRAGLSLMYFYKMRANYLQLPKQ